MWNNITIIMIYLALLHYSQGTSWGSLCADKINVVQKPVFIAVVASIVLETLLLTGGE